MWFLVLGLIRKWFFTRKDTSAKTGFIRKKGNENIKSVWIISACNPLSIAVSNSFRLSCFIKLRFLQDFPLYDTLPLLRPSRTQNPKAKTNNFRSGLCLSRKKIWNPSLSVRERSNTNKIQEENVPKTCETQNPHKKGTLTTTKNHHRTKSAPRSNIDCAHKKTIHPTINRNCPKNNCQPTAHTHNNPHMHEAFKHHTSDAALPGGRCAGGLIRCAIFDGNVVGIRDGDRQVRCQNMLLKSSAGFQIVNGRVRCARKEWLIRASS